jgi:hypothetical protein
MHKTFLESVLQKIALENSTLYSKGYANILFK